LGRESLTDGATIRLVAPNSPIETVKANTAPTSTARATMGRSTSRRYGSIERSVGSTLRTTKGGNSVLTSQRPVLQFQAEMGEREFMIYLDPEKRLNRYRHYHAWQQDSIVEFRIQYEALIEGEWHAIIAPDTREECSDERVLSRQVQ
jgi:hypothetical protein